MKLASGRNGQSGSMLIESLIAILVFSVGVLALVGMQAAAMSNVSDAKYRTEASFLANRVIAEMWTNRNNLASYAYAGGPVPGVLANWVAEVQNVLPDAAANPPQIAVGPGNQVMVTVFWRPPNAATPHNFMAVAYINN